MPRRHAISFSIPGSPLPPSDRWSNDYKYRMPFVIPKERVKGASITYLPIYLQIQSNRLVPKVGGAGTPTHSQLLANPYNKWAYHHRPLGANVKYGVPPSTTNPFAVNPAYTAGNLGSRGCLKTALGRCKFGGDQGTKMLVNVDTGMSSRTIEWQTDAFGGGTGDGLPITLKMPSSGMPEGDGDNEVILWPRNGVQTNVLTDLADCFPQFSFTSRPNPGSGKASARARDTYNISGRDVRNSRTDPDTDTSAWGPGAIDWRHPGGFVQGHEVNLTNPGPIRHILNFTACRHSGQDAAASDHILGLGMTYGAWNIDAKANTTIRKGIKDNRGDIPYGTLMAIRHEDYGLRSTLGLTDFEKQLFDTFVFYGGSVCDGQGQTATPSLQPDGGQGCIQPRLSREFFGDNTRVNAYINAVNKFVPYLWPVFNPRKHDEGDSGETWTDGLPYVGGGGPLDSTKSINTAWDTGSLTDGYVETPEGYDFRLEYVDGTPMPFRRVLWDSVGGLFVFEIAPYILSDQYDNIGYMYVGRPEQTTYESNPLGVASPYEWYWDLATLNDVGERSGRLLVKQGTVTDVGNNTPNGSASHFASAGVLRKTNITHVLSGASQISVAIRFKQDTANVDKGLLNVGNFGVVSSGKLSVLCRAVGQAANNVWKFKVQKTGGASTVESAANTQAAGWQILHAIISDVAGNSNIWVNGVESSSYKDVKTGTIEFASNSLDLNIGTGPAQTAAGGWDGDIDFVRVSGTQALTTDFVNSEVEFYRRTTTYGAFGDFDNPLHTDRTPIAIPMERTIAKSTSTTFDVLARSILPTTGSTSIAITSAPAVGTASIVSNKINYSVGNVTPQTVNFEFSLTSGTKVSKARIYVNITA